MAEQIVLTKDQDDKKSGHIVYIRLSTSLKDFVDKVAGDLGVKRSEAIRRLLQNVRDKGVKIE